MSRHRFYLDATAVDLATQQAWITNEELHHLSRVLRLRPGTVINIFDSQGREFQATIDQITAKEAQLTLIAQLSEVVESPLSLTLVQGISKGERFDIVVQKATELGVTAIQPLISQYTEVALTDARSEKRQQRWQRIALEAAKQAGRRQIPTIHQPITWTTLTSLLAATTVTKLTNAPQAIFFTEQGGQNWTTLMAQLTPRPANIAWWAIVGAEGGWSTTELGQARAAGWHCLTLGPRILRTETAAITAVSLLQHYFGDLR
jgi:16S rRNA (uracil1498-N3)-methyltransferase